MPDHSEKVELQFESRVPSRSDVAGVHHVLKLLSEVERRIQNINRMGVAPQGIQGAQTASHTAAINQQVVALNRLAAAQANVARITRTSFPATKGGGGTFERHSVTGIGQRTIERFSSLTPSADTLESTKVIQDFEVIARAQQKFQKAKAKEYADGIRDEARQIQNVRALRQIRAAEEKNDRDDQIAGSVAIQRALHSAQAKNEAQKAAQLKSEQRAADQLRKAQQKVYNDAYKNSQQPPPRMPSEAKNPLAGFTPTGMAMNIAKVSQWAAAVTVLYKSAELAQYSMSRLIEIGQQTQRLSQVFSGVGGSAQELTRDLLGMAAANGRSTDEAMEAGIAWSRLQLNRVEVNEAVRVSLMAANVAEMNAADSTKALSSIYVTYGLRVSQLSGVLGMLNQSSNTFNVTNRDLLDGLSRSASVAKQAGISFAELQGLITGGVSRSGQSGSNIGNAIKTVLVRLNNPQVQEVLRRRFGVESTSNGGADMKSGSEVLRELFVAYQGLNREERASMSIRIAGATQANRFVAIMDSYVQDQKAAIASQENLNSAEIENAKILNSVKAQLSGVKSEFDKLIVTGGSSTFLGGASINSTLIDGLTTIRGVLRLINSDLSDIMPKWVSTLGGAVSSAASGVMAPGVGLIRAGGAAVRGIESQFSTEGPGSALELFANRKSIQAESAERKSKLLRTIAETMDRDPSLLGQARGAYGAGFDSLNTSNAKASLMARSAELSKQAVSYLRDEQFIKQRLITGIDEQIAKEEQSTNNAQTLNKLIEDRRRLQEGINKLDQDEFELSNAFDANLQKNINTLGRAKSLIQEISQLFDQMPVDTATGKLNAQISKLEQEIGLLEQAHSSLGNAEGNDARVKEAELFHEIQRKKGDLAGAKAGLGLAGEFDSRDFLLRQDRAQYHKLGVGLDESERLANTEKGLRAAEEAHRLMSDRLHLAGQEVEARREALRALEAESELHDLINKKTMLRAKLETDLKNLALEQKKQYAESMLLSGPGDLLRKLSVKQLADRNGGKLKLGDFMALSPEARRDYLDYTGSFKARDLKDQIKSLGPEFDIDKGDANSRRARMIARAGQVNGTEGFDARLGSEAMKAASALSTFTIMLGQANASISALDARMAGLFNAAPAPSSISHPIATSTQGAFNLPSTEDWSRSFFNDIAKGFSRPRLSE